MAGDRKGRNASAGSDFLGRLRGILASLPFLKRLFPPRPSPEPFSSIEDVVTKLDALAEPNAAPQPEERAKRKAPRLDPSASAAALAAALVKRPLLLALLAALLLLLLLLALSSLLVSAPPRPLAPAALPTAAGQALAGKLILPPDPARALVPELEREPKAVYTEEDIARLRPLIAEELGRVDASALAEANDREARILLEAVP